jgi:hypothetical protein
LWKRRVFDRDHILSSSLWFEGFDVNEEINNMMDGILEDKSNGYTYNFLMMPTMMALWKELF